MSKLRDPRDVERQIDDIRNMMTDVLNDASQPESDRRDKFMRMSGEVEALEVQARELRDFEADQMRELINGQTRNTHSRAVHNLTEVRNALLGVSNSLRLGSDGAALVPSELLADYQDKARANDPIYSYAARFVLGQKTAGGGYGGAVSMRLPVKATHGVTVPANEADPRTATTAPTFTEVELMCRDRYGRYDATRAWIDSTPDAERIVLDSLTGDLYDGLATVFAVGSGTNEPLGLFKNTAAGGFGRVVSGTAGAITPTQLLAAYTTLAPKYRINAQWLMSGATLAALSGLSMPNMSNTPLVTWQNGKAFIMGVEVAECTNAPGIGSATHPVALADLANAYAIGTHIQPEVRVMIDNVTSPELSKVYGLVRMGGTPWNPQAAVLLSTATS